MKLRGLGLAAILVLGVGCGADAVESDQVFLDFSTNAVIGGSSNISRFESDKKVEGSGTITMLTPGNIYTIWTVIFNLSSMCGEPNCDLADVAPNVPSKTEIMRAAYGTASAEGTVDYSFTLLEGQMHVEGSTLTPDFGIGFISTVESEIHMVIVDHGAPQPGREAGQRSDYTVGVNCVGGPNMNFCPFVQYAPHYSPNNTKQMQTLPGGHGG
jgi:hypothetical protein